jgi:ribosomal-protein-alanine N-acetyltransferase
MQLPDIAAVLAIEMATSEEPWTHKAFEACLTPPFFAWVLEQNKQIIGFAMLQIVSIEAHLLNFAIAPDWQGKGWGYSALTTLLERIIAQGVRRVSLEVRVSNIVAQTLYEKCGFKPVGRRVNYYACRHRPSGREDAFIWQLNLE